MKQPHLFTLVAFTVLLTACATSTPTSELRSAPTAPAPTSLPSSTPTVVPSATRIPATPTLTATPFPTRPFLITPTRGNLFPFVLPWDDASASVANLSTWIDKPAGKDGFVIARDGHLYAGSQRLRLFGVNVTFSAGFPRKEDAEKIAARMAKFGINAVRFHHMDTQATPNGILQRDARTLDTDQLDRLDYFIAQLRKYGIYANINLHVGRVYPGLPKWDTMPNYFKGVDTFYPSMIEMQRDYARDLLTHRNPYTNLRYTEDPAVVLIEINNEDGLMREWWNGSLDEMPAVYADELTRQWRAWLRAKYATNDALKQAWGIMDEPLGAEMLTNGDLLQGAQGWSLQLIEGARAPAQTTNEAVDAKPALRVQVQQLGKEAWHVQLYQAKLRFQQGRPYTLTFWAKSDVPRVISVNAMQAHDPWQHLWDTNVALTKEWQMFRFVFTPNETDDNGRVTITNLGREVGTYWFAQVSLRPGGLLGLQPGEQLDSLNFLRKADFGTRTPEGQRDWIRFLWEVEDKYWKGMYQFVKDGLGARPLVIGTQVSYSPAPLQAQFDVVDAHSYWQHPRFPGRPWDPVNWSVNNVPMAGVADGGTLPTLALGRVEGKPYIISEYNHPAPNTFSSEAFLLLSTYAALQDWDGIFAFNYEGDTRDGWNPERITNYFAIDQHPTKMVTLPAVAALFLRGDVQSPASRMIAAFNYDAGIERIRRYGPNLGADAFGVNRMDTLRLPVALTLNAKVSSMSPAPSIANVFISDNRQLTWDTGSGKGFVTINTPRSKAFIGYVNKRVIDLGDVRITPGATMQDWCAITLTAIEGNDFKSAGRFLITATGYVENTDMGWKNPEKSTVGRDWGKAPTIVEGIPAAITLTVPASRVRVWSLDERGQRVGLLAVRDVNGNAMFELDGRYGTLWYEIEIQRSS